MLNLTKQTDELEVADLKKHPVWEYVSPEELIVTPVRQLPVPSLTGRLLGTKLKLCNRGEVWAVLSNVSLASRHATEHFLTVWIEKDRRWFELARYHDVDYATRGPQALASFLGLPLEEVFPISYEFSPLVVIASTFQGGTILREPSERLTQTQLIELAIRIAKDES